MLISFEYYAPARPHPVLHMRFEKYRKTERFSLVLFKFFFHNIFGRIKILDFARYKNLLIGVTIKFVGKLLRQGEIWKEKGGRWFAQNRQIYGFFWHVSWCEVWSRAIDKRKKSVCAYESKVYLRVVTTITILEKKTFFCHKLWVWASKPKLAAHAEISLG